MPWVVPPRRALRWLTLVRTEDQMRTILNRGFAYAISILIPFTVLLALVTISRDNGVTTESLVHIISIPVELLAWWLNRRGTAYGAMVFALLCMFATVVGIPPVYYAGSYPIVHGAFMFAIVIAALFVRPSAGIWASSMQLALLVVAMFVSQVPLVHIWQFLLVGALHLGAMAVVMLVGASLLWRALRTAISSNDELQALNADLEQRITERTAALEDAYGQLQVANQALHAAKETAEHGRSAAEEANRLKTQFLTTMTHELRTPLNAIINYTQFIGYDEFGPLSEDQRMFRSRVLYNSEHLLDLINDLLDISKIEIGRLDLMRDQVHLGPLLQGVEATVSGLAEEKGLELVLDAASDLPLVWIDKRRVRQVLINLLGNAVKFTEEGRITLSARATDDGMVELAVTDTGIGIDPQHQELIFEEFRQVEGGLDRSYQGAGLGLSISKQLVELHGGHMTLRSRKGEGSTFAFTLPVAHDRRGVTVPVLRRQGVTQILIVDDDSDSQHILQRILEQAGYQVHCISNSAETLAAIRRIRPALVILDLVMGPYNGWQVLQQIQRDPTLADVPVVICSGSELHPALVAMLPQVHGALQKPIQRDELIALVGQFRSAGAVLVVDDNPDARAVLRTMLVSLGRQVLEAADGASALVLLARHRPALMLLDLMMPGMDGFAVLEQMRTMPEVAEVPVVVVSAKDLTAEEQTWLASRVRHYVPKSPSSLLPLNVLQDILKEGKR